MAALTAECCTSAPLIVAEGYTRVGEVKETKNGLKYYESAKETTRSDLAVLIIYDIFGSGVPQTDQQADRISKGLGCKVVSPYWFGVSGGFPGDMTAPGGRDALWKWVSEVAPAEKLQERCDDILATLKAEGYSKFAILGFCWGGVKAREFATKPDLFFAAASIHGHKYTPEQAAELVVPFYNMPSKSEGPQPDFDEALPVANGVKEKSRSKLFDDVPHGFAAARGQWATDETHRKRAEEAIEEFVNWVKELAA